MSNYQIKKILLVTDFSVAAQTAQQFAVSLAKKCKASIIVLNVIEITAISSPDGSYSDYSFATQAMLNSAKEQLSKIEKNINEQDHIPTKAYVMQGILVENITRATLLYAADLIVVGSSSKVGLLDGLLGSNAYRIVNYSNIPVITVPENVRFKRVTKILFPVNDELVTLQKADEIITLAKILNADIQVLGISSDIGKTWIVEEHILQVTKILELHEIKYTRKIIHGNNYGEEILKVCNTNTEILAAVASKQEHGMLSLFQSKHDEKLVNHADVPVLSVPVSMQ